MASQRCARGNFGDHARRSSVCAGSHGLLRQRCRGLFGNSLSGGGFARPRTRMRSDDHVLDKSAAHDRMTRDHRPDEFLLSVVVPCYNEQDVLVLTYQRIRDTLGTAAFALQLVLVDDGSDDRTGQIISELAVGDPRIKPVWLSRNFGHQAAISAGLDHAEGDIVAIIDADLQDPPEVIFEMIEKWRAGADVVYGIRRKRKEGLMKRAAYTAFYRIFKRLT